MPSFQIKKYSIMESRVNLLLSHMIEHGFVSHFIKSSEELLYSIKSANITRIQKCYFEEAVMDFNHFYDYFVLYIIGIGLSFITVCVEILVLKFHGSKIMKMMKNLYKF